MLGGADNGHEGTTILLTREGMSPLLVTNVELAIPNIELKPNLEEMQAAINEAAKYANAMCFFSLNL